MGLPMLSNTLLVYDSRGSEQKRIHRLGQDSRWLNLGTVETLRKHAYSTSNLASRLVGVDRGKRKMSNGKETTHTTAFV